MNLAMLTHVPAKRLAAMSGLGACGPCSRVSPLSGLGVIDFGGGVDAQGRQQVAPALVPTSDFMMSSVVGLSDKHSVPTLQTRLSQQVAAMETTDPEQVVIGRDGPDPSALRAGLVAMADNHCHLYPDVCVGVNVSALIDSLIAQYTMWRNSALARYYDLVASGAIAPMANAVVPPPPGYVPYNQVTGASAPPSNEIYNPVPGTYPAVTSTNVLTNVTPVAPSWYQAPTASVLAPPQSQPPVPISSIQQTFTGSQALVTGVNEGPAQGTGTDWLKDNWVLLAVAAGALFLLGGRR